MLYRLSGEPETAGSLSDFGDTAKVAGYAQKAVAWAVENDILRGSDGNILPESNATREQAVAILLRYIQYTEQQSE